MTQFEQAVKKQEEIEYLKRKLKQLKEKQKTVISNVLDTLYSLEEVYDFDETSTGKQIGEIVNKLQSNFLNL